MWLFAFLNTVHMSDTRNVWNGHLIFPNQICHSIHIG